MTLTREQRIEAYTYALFWLLSGWQSVWVAINSWEIQKGLWFTKSINYLELWEITVKGMMDDENEISALRRAIEEAEKSKV